jgi:hypothetical protein
MTLAKEIQPFIYRAFSNAPFLNDAFLINPLLVRGCLQQTRETLERIQDRNSKPKDTDAHQGSRLALYGGPYRPAMTEHQCKC